MTATFGPLTLSALADVAGLNVEDVRFYLARGLLQPPRRRRGRSCDVAFHQEHIDRLQFIARALAHGFTFDDIQSLVTTSFQTPADVYRIAARRLDQLKKLVGPKAPAVETMERLLEKCPKVGPLQACTILDTLSNRNCSSTD
jgi:MerR family mercuric resistance operon transcriptional regulator